MTLPIWPIWLCAFWLMMIFWAIWLKK